MFKYRFKGLVVVVDGGMFQDRLFLNFKRTNKQIYCCVLKIVTKNKLTKNVFLFQKQMLRGVLENISYENSQENFLGISVMKPSVVKSASVTETFLIFSQNIKNGYFTKLL